MSLFTRSLPVVIVPVSSSFAMEVTGDGLQRLDGDISGGSYGDIAVAEEGAVRVIGHIVISGSKGVIQTDTGVGECAGFRDGSFLPDRPCHESWHRCRH